MKDLRPIQSRYLELLDSHFVQEREELARAGGSIRDFALAGGLVGGSKLVLSTEQGERSSFEFRLECLREESAAFWQENRETLFAELRAENVLRVGIELAEKERIPAALMWIDTILVESPFGYLSPTAKSTRVSLTDQVRLFGTLVALLDVRDLVLADVDPPLVVIVPSPFVGDVKQDADIIRWSDSFSIPFLAETLGEQEVPETFEALSMKVSNSDLRDLNDRLLPSNVDSVVRLIVEGLAGTNSMSMGIDSLMVDRIVARRATWRDIKGLLAVCGSHFYGKEKRIHEFRRMGADYCHTTENEWAVRTWMHRFIAERFGKELGFEEGDSLAWATTQRLPWLKDLSHEEAIVLRQRDVLGELRRLVRHDLDRLRRAPLESFREAARDFEAAVDSAIQQEAAEFEHVLRARRVKSRRALVSLGAGSALGFASFAFPAMMPLTLAALGYGIVVGSSSVRDVVNDHLAGRKRVGDWYERPIALLATRLEESMGRD